MKNLGKAATWVACLGMLGAFSVSVSALTSGFEHWTFEDRRIALAQRSAITAPPVSLIAASGEDRQYWPGAGRQRIYLVDFIYTRCPSVCQALGSEYERMQAALRSQQLADVQLLSISFDARDTVADLRDYAKRFRAAPDSWTIGKPSHMADTQRLLQDLGVVVVPDGIGGYVHNAAIHLINGEGELVAIFPYEEWEAALAAASRYANEAGGVQ